MRISGRKTSDAYEIYGFIPKVENGKHTAICTACNRVLQNTAAMRLQKHRNACIAANKNANDPSKFLNLEVKIHDVPQSEKVQQNDKVNTTVKTEQCDMEFEDTNINDNGNDNITYEDSEEVATTNRKKRARKSSINDEIQNTSQIYDNSNEAITNDINSIQSPITTSSHQQQHHQQAPKIFEANTTKNNTFSALDDDDIEEINDEDLLNIEEELNVIENLMPRSKESQKLQEELTKAETEYYRIKAAYFTKLTENCKIKRTLMLLESRKLQLEIEKLTN